MPKVKTNSSAKKRFKVTATGKIMHQKAFKRHILTKKSKKRPPRPQPNHDDLVICGYGSNVFRNDDLAYSIDKGDMLVRWRDDESVNLTIDR